MNSFKEFTEALSIQQRLKIGRAAKRTAKKRARSAKRKAKKMKSPKEIQKKAANMARAKLMKKLSGGKSASELSIGQKMQLGKKLDKLKPKLAKMTKKYVKFARKAEIQRLATLRGSK
jgi:hypothetical protein